MSAVSVGEQEGVEESDVYMPDIVRGQVFYEWPSTDGPVPIIEWKAGGEQAENQVDRNGGQQFKVGRNREQVLRIQNTDKFWNWQPSRSIMRLSKLHDKTFREGDTVHLSLDILARTGAKVGLYPDGGRINEDRSGPWAMSWAYEEIEIKARTTWQLVHRSFRVEPTEEGYDPAERGTTLYLTSSAGANEVAIRRIKIARVPNGS